MKNIIICMLLIFCVLNAVAQLTIERGAIFHIQDKAGVTLQGDLSSANNIEGDGYLELAGTRMARIDMKGFKINNLLLKSPAILESDVAITSNITLQAGRLDLNNHNIVLDRSAAISGDENNYIQTTGTGTIKKNVAGTLSNYTIPLGTSTSYMPLQISAGENYQNGALTVGARESTSDHKPFHVKDYLKHHWIVQREGNLQNIIATGYYRPTDVEGISTNVSAFYWDGYSWKSQPDKVKKEGTATVRITSAAGELYAMNDVVHNINSGIMLLNNPARTYAVLQINTPVDKAYHVVLRDITGRQLQVTDLKVLTGVNRHTVYLNGLSQGTYFLDISSASEKQSLKFLKIE